MDLLLVNPCGREVVYQELGESFTAVEPPLWCRLIAGYCADRGHEVGILDAEAEQIGPAEIAKRIIAKHPMLVCLVVYGHQPSASTQQMAGASAIATEIKTRNCSFPILIVGGHVAALPARTVWEEDVDYACNSEGPVTVERLLVHLKGGCALVDVPGIVVRDQAVANGHVEQTPAPPLLDVKELHGKVWDMLPMGKYRAHNWQCFDNLGSRQPYASIYTSLGCPYKCSFCCINAPFHSNRYRMRHPSDVVDEISQLHALYNVSTFKIVDEMFVLNDKHYGAICQGLADLPYADDLNIWAYARIDTVKPDKLSLLRRAGVRWLALGIESGDASVRDGAQKSLDQSDILSIVRAIQKSGINVIGNFIFGLPDDTFTSMQDTFDLAEQLNCEFVNFYSAMAYPGSPLFSITAPDDLPSSWAGYSQHSYDCRPMRTKALTSANVLEFRDRAFHLYFESDRYLDMLGRKFGNAAVRNVNEMTRHRLRRRLFERVI